MQQKQVALITGAARRVGAEIARVLHAANYNVVLHYYHSEKEAAALFQELIAIRPHSAFLLRGNLAGNEQGLKKLVQQAYDFCGCLDVLVNNAACFFATKIGATETSDWQKLFDVNLKAPFFLASAAVPFLQQSAAGSIINITDIHGEHPLRHYAVYCMTKAGLIMLTKALAKELAPIIRVNAVSPGVVALPEGENFLDDQTEKKILRHIPLERFGHPADVAQTVLFLVREATYMTGQTVAVDGGRSLWG